MLINCNQTIFKLILFNMGEERWSQSLFIFIINIIEEKATNNEIQQKLVQLRIQSVQRKL